MDQELSNPAKRVKIEEQVLDSTSTQDNPTFSSTPLEHNETNSYSCAIDAVNSNLLRDANDAVQNSNRIHYKPEIDEKKLGIELFIGDERDQFHGLIKTRYADFIVHETDLDGVVAILTNLDAPDCSPEDLNKLNLTDFVSENDKQCLSEVNNGYLNEYRIDVSDLDKENRTSLHHAIRHSFDKLESSTVIEVPEKKDSPEDEETSQVKEKKYILVKKRTKNARPRNVWPRERPDHVHFILYKENRDTLDAIHCLAGAVNMRPSNFLSAGVKDRRAVTSQWISCWRVEPKKLIMATRRFNKRPVIKVGNFCFKKDGLKVGQLKSNKFDIVIRNLVHNCDGAQVIDKSMNSIKENGFINYFGLQRFGTRSSQTYEIGLAILQSKFEKAVDLIISYKYDEGFQHSYKSERKECAGQPDSSGDNQNHTKRKWATGAETHNSFVDCWKSRKDPNLLFKKFPSFRFTNEGTIIRSLAKSGTSANDYLTAIVALPRNMRSLYVHSYQSFIWNKLTTLRIKLFGLKVVAGDLVLLKNSNLSEAIETSADLCDETNLQDDAKIHLNLSEKEQKNGDDYHQNLDSNIVIVTEEDKHNYSIFDVVLPMIGSRVRCPQNAIGKELDNILAKDGLSMDSFKQREKTFVSYGSYRHVMVKPTNVSWELKTYSNPNQSLVLTDLEKLENTSMDKDELAKRQQLTEVKSDFSDEALVVGFELPPSSYATMCLREIMKKPSTEFNNRF